MHPTQYTIFIAEAVGAVILTVLFIKSRLPKQTIENYEALSASQEKRIKSLEDNEIAAAKEIADLKARVEVVQNIPLIDIAKAIKEIVNTQKAIIKIIQKEG